VTREDVALVSFMTGINPPGAILRTELSGFPTSVIELLERSQRASRHLSAERGKERNKRRGSGDTAQVTQSGAEGVGNENKEQKETKNQLRQMRAKLEK
jgi:hypothetical protein